MRDEALVDAALAGDPAAFAALAGRSRARAQAVVERMVGDEAEDVVQEALLRAFLGLSQLRDPTRLDAWLCGIAVNVAKMRLRRRRLEVRAGGDAPAEASSEEEELLELVREAVSVLPARQRDAVLMHYVDGLSCQEIASLVDSTPGAVRVRLHRAREQLRARLAPAVPSAQAGEERRMNEVRLEDVLVRIAEDDPAKVVSDQRIVLLAETAGERRIAIWIGAAEGDALALGLGGETTPRPLTSDLMAELVRVTGARVEHVTVTALREKTFYAAIALAVDGRVEELDARPSDALNLAVRLGVPILVEAGVLEQAALPADGVDARLAADARRAGLEVPPGEWRSLSAELVRARYRLL